MGGVRAVRAFCALRGHPSPEVFHTNEGHAGFLGLERIREYAEQGLSFDEALEVGRAATVFTTHTPVPAGIDRFERSLIREHFADDPLLPVDRVLALEVLDAPAQAPAEAEHRDVDQGLFRPSPDDVRVELELSASGRWVAEYYPCESVSELDDGRLRVVLRTPDTGWVRRRALQLGEDGRVVSPPELAAEIRDAAAAALANYAE